MGYRLRLKLNLLVDQSGLGTLSSEIREFCHLAGTCIRAGLKLGDNLLTKVQVPRRTITRYLERSGTLSGMGEQASSGMVVSVDKAYMGNSLVIGSLNVEK